MASKPRNVSRTKGTSRSGFARSRKGKAKAIEEGNTRMPIKKRKLIVISTFVLMLGAGIIVVFAAFSAKAGANDPRFLTTTDAELAAIARFQNFSLGTREVSLTFVTNEGSVTVDGFFDYRTGSGGAEVTFEEGTDQRQVIWWTPHEVGTLREMLPVETTIEELFDRQVSPDDWDFIPMDRAMQSQLGQALFFVASLGTDRPENPKLLEQSDAVWLASGVPGESAGWDPQIIQPSTSGENYAAQFAQSPFFWFQLPSIDEVRSGEAKAEVAIQRPRLLIDAAGTIWQAEFVHRQSGAVTVVRFGTSIELSVSQPADESGQ